MKNMMNVISNNIFRIHKIHVVDIGKNNILETTKGQGGRGGIICLIQ